MISLTFNFGSLEEAQNFLASAAGEAVETTGEPAKRGRGKASAKAAEGAAQTAAANTPPATPAKAAPSEAEAKAVIGGHFGPTTRPGYVEDVTEFVKSFGVAVRRTPDCDDPGSGSFPNRRIRDEAVA